MSFPAMLCHGTFSPLSTDNNLFSYIETRCESGRAAPLFIFLQVHRDQYHGPVVDIGSLTGRNLLVFTEHVRLSSKYQKVVHRKGRGGHPEKEGVTGFRWVRSKGLSPAAN